MGKRRAYDRHISFNPRIIEDDARLNLGMCLIRQARLGEAKANLKVIKGFCSAMAADNLLPKMSVSKLERKIFSLY